MTHDDIPSELSEAGLGIVQQILDAVVMHADFERVMTSSVEMANQMIQIKMPSGIIVIADPGMGKTLLLEAIYRKLSSNENKLAKERPILRITLDSDVDTHKMAGRMLMALGYPMLPSRPNLENMSQMVDTAMGRLKPKALLIDEAQHMCEGNREITARAVTDWLKVRMDKHNLPVVACGTKTLERIFLINPQFVSRASASYTLNPFQPGESWMKLLRSLVRSVSRLDISCIEAHPRTVHLASAGNLRRLKKLLVQAAIDAIRSNSSNLSQLNLAAGYERAFGLANGMANPFNQNRTPA